MCPYGFLNLSHHHSLNTLISEQNACLEKKKKKRKKIIANNFLLDDEYPPRTRACLLFLPRNYTELQKVDYAVLHIDNDEKDFTVKAANLFVLQTKSSWLPMRFICWLARVATGSILQQSSSRHRAFSPPVSLKNRLYKGDANGKECDDNI